MKISVEISIIPIEIWMGQKSGSCCPYSVHIGIFRLALPLSHQRCFHWFRNCTTPALNYWLRTWFEVVGCSFLYTYFLYAGTYCSKFSDDDHAHNVMKIEEYHKPIQNLHSEASADQESTIPSSSRFTSFSVLNFFNIFSASSNLPENKTI